MFFFRKKITDAKKQPRVQNRRVHMANERTFLAWIRTSIGIMAFGFIIEKVLVPDAAQEKEPFAFLGILVVILGAGAALLATYRFLKTKREIVEDTFRPSMIADVLLAILLGAIGLLLVIYLTIAL